MGFGQPHHTQSCNHPGEKCGWSGHRKRENLKLKGARDVANPNTQADHGGNQQGFDAGRIGKAVDVRSNHAEQTQQGERPKSAPLLPETQPKRHYGDETQNDEESMARAISPRGPNPQFAQSQQDRDAHDAGDQGGALGFPFHHYVGHIRAGDAQRHRDSEQKRLDSRWIRKAIKVGEKHGDKTGEGQPPELRPSLTPANSDAEGGNKRKHGKEPMAGAISPRGADPDVAESEEQRDRQDRRG